MKRLSYESTALPGFEQIPCLSMEFRPGTPPFSPSLNKLRRTTRLVFQPTIILDSLPNNMGKSRQDVLRSRTSASRRPGGGISSTNKPNVFEILVDEGQVSPLLNLPRELRDTIYELVLIGATISQQVEYNQQDDFEQGSGGSEYSISSRPILRNHSDPLQLHSMVFVSKQVSREFLEAVPRCVPVHIRYGTEDRGFWRKAGYIPRHVKIQAKDLCQRVPYTAHMSVSSSFYSYAHEREVFRGSEDLQRDFLKPEPFKHLATLFSVCKQTTHIAFHCTLHIRGEASYRSFDDSYPLESCKCKIIYEYLQTALESLPKLLRYSLVVRISKPRISLLQGKLRLGVIPYSDTLPCVIL